MIYRIQFEDHVILSPNFKASLSNTFRIFKVTLQQQISSCNSTKNSPTESPTRVTATYKSALVYQYITNLEAT